MMRRPQGSQRFLSPQNFLLKTEDGRNITSSLKAWLVKKYIKLNGFEITKHKMREGLLKEIKIHEKWLCQSKIL